MCTVWIEIRKTLFFLSFRPVICFQFPRTRTFYNFFLRVQVIVSWLYTALINRSDLFLKGKGAMGSLIVPRSDRFLIRNLENSGKIFTILSLYKAVFLKYWINCQFNGPLCHVIIWTLFLHIWCKQKEKKKRNKTKYTYRKKKNRN